MSIKYAMLGLIAEQPMHGYRLKEAFDERLSTFWGLSTAQVYQTLNALERAGLLASRGEQIGSRPARRIYTLTDAGTRALERWLDGIRVPWARPFRADVLLRLMFVREVDIARLSDALDRHEHDLLHLCGRVARLPRHVPSKDRINVSGLFVERVTHQLDGDLKLLRRCRDEITRWSRARKVAAATVASPSRSHPTKLDSRNGRAAAR
jgi:DNA-binding PadR family transcriptional regulator